LYYVAVKWRAKVIVFINDTALKMEVTVSVGCTNVVFPNPYL